MSNPVRKIFLIRHCEPEEGYVERFVGQTNPGLSPLGRQQAERVGSRHREISQLPIWTSPLRRALQTAELAFPEAVLCIEPLAMERHLGVLEGVHPAAALRLFPEAMEHLQRDPLTFIPNGGEGWKDIQARAKCLGALIRAEPSLVIVSHQLLIYALASELTKVPLNYLYGLPLAHGDCWVLAQAGDHMTLERADPARPDS